MTNPVHPSESKIPTPPVSSAGFWDLLAPHHAVLENNYFELRSLRWLRPQIVPPVLVVGAGQGLIVGELQKQGVCCDGIDLSSEMIRYAKSRRGLSLIQADARALPFSDEAYRTIIYATGVLDFIGDEETIGLILREGRRVAGRAGRIFAAFYRLSAAQEQFLTKVGLLQKSVLAQKRALELYLLKPLPMLAWVAKHAGVSYFRAALLLFSMVAESTMREKIASIKMQRIFRNGRTASALLDTAPEELPYRDESEIRNLFRRLTIPMKQFQALPSCYIVEI